MMDNLMEKPAWCEKCHAHIIPIGLAELLWSRIAFRLVMWWPVRFLMSPPCVQMLPWAGNIAWRCSCFANNARARANQEPNNG